MFELRPSVRQCLEMLSHAIQSQVIQLGQY